ncbi:MAG: hypothetical protein U0414_22145 [Polyangiaceae bacterium]
MRAPPNPAWLCLAVTVIAACASAGAPADAAQPSATSDTVEASPRAASSAPPRRPRAARAPDPAASAASEDDICVIDPILCATPAPDPKALAACGCDKLDGRDRQLCLVDCVAREREELEHQLGR